MNQKEIRVIRRPLELRAVKGDDGGNVFTGYVFKWGEPSDDLGGFVETVRRGAAAKFLAAPPHNLFAVLDHNKDVAEALGDLESGTLKLEEDEVGMRFEIHAGPTTAAKDAAIVVNRNRVGMSFAFVRGADRWSTLPDGTKLRELLEFADLDNVSIVVDPAYKSSDVTVAKRGLQEAIDAETRRESERIETEKRQAADAKRLAEETEQRKHKEIARWKRRTNDRASTICSAAWTWSGWSTVTAASALPRHRKTPRTMRPICGRPIGRPSGRWRPSDRPAHPRGRWNWPRRRPTSGRPPVPRPRKSRPRPSSTRRRPRCTNAASSDEYAADFTSGMNYRSLERRDNAHHDEDGKFHDGSPESILAASRGKLTKAEAPCDLCGGLPVRRARGPG